MQARRRHVALFAVLAAAAGLFCTSQATAVEDGLMDVRIGASYRELIRRLGQPTGILFSAGGSMMYQMTPRGAEAGLPIFGAQPATAETPLWVLPVMPGYLGDQQSEWLYDLRHTKGVVLGAILAGKGADAVVTDVVVAGYPENLKGKAVPVRTEKGIALQSTFLEILKRYGYPPMIEIYAPSAPATGAGGGRAGGGAAAGVRAGRGAAGAGGGMRAGRGMGGGGRGMRGGAQGGRRMRGDLGITTRAIVSAPRSEGQHVGPPGLATASFQVELTGGMRSGMRGGGMGGGGMGGRRGGGGGGLGGGRGGMRGGRFGGAGAGRGTLPPLTAAALPAGQAAVFTATATVNNQAISFSRDCILIYEGIAFTLHDMKVVRIHVSE
jgi:hypothetical protein